MKEPIRESLTPTAKAVGKALERTFTGTLGWIVLPVELSAAYKDVMSHRVSKIKERLKDKDEQQILAEITPQIAGPAFEKLRYIDEDSLLENFFITLLARALDKDTVSDVHPAFVDKLSQLSPDEALLLLYLKSGNILKGTVEYEINDTGSYKKIINAEFCLDEIKLNFPQNAHMYVRHLDSLNLIDAGIDNSERTSTRDIKTANTIRTCRESYSISLSDMGKMFSQACIAENINLKDLKGTRSKT